MHGGPALAPAAQAPTAFSRGAVRGLSVSPGASSGSGSVYFVEALRRPERAEPPRRPRPRARPPRVAGGCSRQGEPGARRGRQPGQRRDRRPGPGGADRSGEPGGAAGPRAGWALAAPAGAGGRLGKDSRDLENTWRHFFCLFKM